jgi:asparagine synthase (glutamine-hydrolysing)
MCGICGIVSPGGGRVEPDKVHAMLDRMVHRGPDSAGVYQEPGICAGIRRLAVIDVAHGNQPIGSEDGQVQVVFNGEIYNFRELRADLESRGHSFRTRADTEVLVHLWEEFGLEMVDHLNGMFTFCIHDRTTRRTFIARDRIGIKPLFYQWDGKTVLFASELAVLLKHPDVDRTVRQEALPRLYALQYLPGDETVYRSIRKLLPGQGILVQDGQVSFPRIWEFPTPDPAPEISLEERADELRIMLAKAVAIRTVADVPLGMFLSGGLDSGVVLSLLTAASNRPVQTFSVGFDDAGEFDERPFATLLATHFGAQHHELVVSAADIGAKLPEMVEHLDAPVTDPAMIPTWLLSEYARQEVTVVLTGEGADELFAGYRRYLFQKKYGWVSALPAAGHLARSGLGKRLPGRAGQAFSALAESGSGLNHVEWSMILSPDTGQGLFGKESFEQVRVNLGAGFEKYFEDNPTRLAGSLHADQNEWLPHNLLAKVDLATMAFSLEARVPFLDHRLVEWAARLPDSHRISGSVTKQVLRTAFQADLPAEILSRPKRGFDLPLGDWIRGPLLPVVQEMFRPEKFKRWHGLDGEYASSMLRRHLAEERNLGLPLFNLLSILLFLEKADRL